MNQKFTWAAVLLFWTVTAAVAPAGCSSSEDDSGKDPLAKKSGLNSSDYLHFLSRTHFSYTAADLANISAVGMEAYVDQMLVLPSGTAVETAAMAAEVTDPDFPSRTELVRWWLYLMRNSPTPFQEVMGLFWHNQFATATDVLGSTSLYWFFDHINLWRHKGTGNLRALLVDMSKDWTMLRWLDGVSSTVGAPNENFPREFWELFTLGADNGYTQPDIEEAARVFTGYRTRLIPDLAGPGRDQLVIEFQASRHDATDKTIFGKTLAGISGGGGHMEYDALVDLTLAERDVAEYICRALWEYFCYLNPADSLVADLASQLRQRSYDLKPVLKRILTSNGFYSAEARAGIVKSPLEFAIGFIRTTGLDLTSARLDSAVTRGGQRPTQPPSVNGWPGGQFWLSSAAMVERANLLRECVYRSSEAPQAGYDVAVLLPNPPVGFPTADKTVDHFAWMLNIQLNSAQRQDCIDYLNTDQNGAGSVFSDPWDWNDPAMVNKKVRGLLYILGQHPSYHLR